VWIEYRSEIFRSSFLWESARAGIHSRLYRMQANEGSMRHKTRHGWLLTSRRRVIMNYAGEMLFSFAGKSDDRKIIKKNPEAVFFGRARGPEFAAACGGCRRMKAQ